MFLSCQATATSEREISAPSPIEIIVIAPAAKSSGARILIVPPIRVAIRLKMIKPKGTIKASDMIIARYIQPIPIGAVNMFCIQASVPRTAIATSEPIIAPRLNSGLRAKAGTISAIAPSAVIRISM